MKTFDHIKAIFYLIVMIIVASFALNHSIYGWIVSVRNPSIYELNLANIENENLQKNRYLKIKEANSIVEPLIWIDEHGHPNKYVYALTTLMPKDNHTNENKITSKIILESDNEITNWKETEIVGLLSPYWESIDEDIINKFGYEGVFVQENAEYLTLNSKPWKWYWHTLIILLAVLFFYRMFEAIIKKVKESDN